VCGEHGASRRGIFPKISPIICPILLGLDFIPILWQTKKKRGDSMLKPTKVQIDPKDYEFIKKAYRRLRYKSLSDYMRKAVAARVQEDRKKFRELKRKEAMEMLDATAYRNVFESIEGDDFESR